MNKHDFIRDLLELAQTTQDADAMLEKHTGLVSIEEKTAYLTGMFGVEIVSRHDGGGTSEAVRKQDDYVAILATIIDRKWR